MLGRYALGRYKVSSIGTQLIQRVVHVCVNPRFLMPFCVRTTHPFAYGCGGTFAHNGLGKRVMIAPIDAFVDDNVYHFIIKIDAGRGGN